MEAIVLRACDQCGKDYEAQRATSRFCGSTCRVRASKAPKAEVRALPGGEESVLVAAVRVELVDAGRLDTALGRNAMELATRIVSGRDSGAAVASLSKELRATLAEAVRGARAQKSHLEGYRDELAARRRA